MAPHSARPLLLLTARPPRDRLLRLLHRYLHINSRNDRMDMGQSLVGIHDLRARKSPPPISYNKLT